MTDRTAKFRNFIDEATDFGRIDVTNAELLTRYQRRYRLTQTQMGRLINVLIHAGIL